ncbi:prophage tail fiber N-terminal domain-containing protein [Serratia plymuthica]|uniref:prophage tail fiber N-terminal domain-containing protein n=1 Tax=Serratia plymuthica TaxID=82996 RepID=UPI0018D77206|nr:prophage tail fiber N-terminal domain-containing protein [Serratia plymuthica]QPS88851.1 prophage tail fiber N-terminal domain-containing protein [Serratia plymuthica]
MSILVEGTLLSPAGHVIGNADIVLTSISTSLVVLGGTPISIQTDPVGRYSFTLNNGNYAVSVSKDGNNWFSGMITVTDLTVPKSINALILQDAMMAEIPSDYWSYFQAQTGILFTSFGKIDDAVASTSEDKETVLSAKQVTIDAKNVAVAASDNAQNIADANTYYITQGDPDGTIAGIAGTPSGKSFRVGLGEGKGFKYYVNNNGVALEIAAIAGADLATVSVYPNDKDPNGIKTGLSLTTPGQTFRVLFNEGTGPNEIVYQNNGTSAIRIAEIASQSAMERLLMGAGILTESDSAYAIEFVDRFLRRAVGVANNGRLEANAGLNISGVPITDLPEDSDYCVLFRDARDRVAFGIGKTGFIEINGMRIFVTEGDNLVEIVDSFQRVAGGINSKGGIFSNTDVTNELDSKDSFMLFSELLHLFIYGQSLSNGAFGTPILNTPVSNALMFNTGVRSNGKNPSSLIPLKESVTDSNGETIASGLAHGFVAHSGGMYGRQLILNGAGVNGSNIEGLMKGTNNYAQAVSQFNFTAQQAKLNGVEYSHDFMLFMQGETNMANGTPASSYKTKQVQLYTDFDNDTAQSRSPGTNLVMLTYQTSSHGYYVGTEENPPEMIAQAQLELALTHPNIDMWGPTYMGLPGNHTSGQGNVHHNNHGYRIQGLYAAKAIRHRIRTRTAENPNGEKYLPVHAISAKKINDTTAMVELFTYHPPFVIDASLVSELADGNHGVELRDDTGRLAIASVEIVGGTKLKISSESTIGSGAFVAFAWTPENRGEITSGPNGNRYSSWFFGRETGVRTTIHDSDPETTVLLNEYGKPYPLYNYLPIQKIYLS